MTHSEAITIIQTCRSGIYSGVLHAHHSVLKKSNCSAVILKCSKRVLATTRHSILFQSMYRMLCVPETQPQARIIQTYISSCSAKMIIVRRPTCSHDLVSCPDQCLPPTERSGYVSSNPGDSIKILMRPIRLQNGVNCVCTANQIARK